MPPWSVPPVVVAQAQALRQPWPPPPLPTAAPPLPCTPQMPSDLLVHPRCETTKAPPGVTHRHVTDPAPQDRVDQRDHALEEVGLVPTAYRLPLPHPCRALLALGRIPRPPDAWSAPHPPAVKAQAAARLPLSPVDDPAFLLLTGHFEGGQFLPEAFVSPALRSPSCCGEASTTLPRAAAHRADSREVEGPRRVPAFARSSICSTAGRDRCLRHGASPPPGATPFWPETFRISLRPGSPSGSLPRCAPLAHTR